MSDYQMKKHPIGDCVLGALATIKKGGKIHQKFQCARCNAYNYMEVPNAFYESGECSDCGHVTDIVKDGCNYVAIFKC